MMLMSCQPSIHGLLIIFALQMIAGSLFQVKPTHSHDQRSVGSDCVSYLFKSLKLQTITKQHIFVACSNSQIDSVKGSGYLYKSDHKAKAGAAHHSQMDSAPKFSLKDQVLVKLTNNKSWAGEIIDIMPQSKMYQVKVHNDTFIGYFKEADLKLLTNGLGKYKIRKLRRKNKKQEELRIQREQRLKGFKLALQQMRNQQEVTGQGQFCQAEQKIQHGLMQNSKQLTLQQIFQTAKKRRNTSSLGSMQKVPTKRQKLDNQEQSSLGAHQDQVEIHHQPACRQDQRQQGYSQGHVDSVLWLQKKLQLKMIEWKSPEKEGLESQKMEVKEAVRFDRQQQIAEAPSLTAETCANTSEENQHISTVKQSEPDVYLNNGNKNQAHAEGIENKCEQKEQQVHQCENKAQLGNRQCSVDIVGAEIIQNQHKSCEISVQIVEDPNRLSVQPHIVHSVSDLSKNEEQDCQIQQQNQPQRAQCSLVEVAQNSHLSSIQILDKIADQKEQEPIIQDLQDQQDNYDNKNNFIQSSFRKEDEHQLIQPQISPQINKIDQSHSRDQGPSALQQISGRKQLEKVIIIIDSQAEAEAEPQSPKIYPINPPKQQIIIPTNRQATFIDADRYQQPQIFAHFQENQFQEEGRIQQPISIVESSKSPQNEIRQWAHLMQSTQPVNSIAQLSSIPQLQPPETQEVPAVTNNQPEISCHYQAETIKQQLQQKHESQISPIAEQSEEDEEQDAHSKEAYNYLPNAQEQVERMEIEDPLEEASIDKPSKLSVDFKINLEEEKSQNESEGISNPVFQVLQKKVDLQTELGNIERLYKQQFVSPHNYPSLIKALPALSKKMKELPEPLLAQVVKQYLPRIIAYLSAKTEEPNALLTFGQKHIFLASLTSEGLSPETVFQEGIIEEFERVVALYEQGSARKAWMNNYLVEYSMVKAKLEYFRHQYKQTHMFNEDQKSILCPNMAYA